MPIDGQTIIFNYNPNDQKYFVPLGLIFLFVPFVIFACSFVMEVSWFVYIIALPFLIASIYMFVIAWVMKRKAEKGVYISVSPKGVTTPKGKFYPIKDIDYCHIQFFVAKETGLIFNAHFHIQLKSGKKKHFKFGNYIVPFDWDMKSFPQKVNDIIGIPLLRDSVITVQETFTKDT